MVAGLTADVFVQLTATLAHLSSTMNKTGDGGGGMMMGPPGGKGRMSSYPDRNELILGGATGKKSKR